MRLARSLDRARRSRAAAVAIGGRARDREPASPRRSSASPPDALVRIGAAQPPEPPADLPDVALVAIDPQSVRALPDWPWPRSVYAQAVRRLDAAGAKAIAIDIDFSAARDAAEDAEFARAIADSGRVVLAALPTAPDASGRRRDRGREPADSRARGERRRHRQRADAGRVGRRRALRAAREPDRRARDSRPSRRRRSRSRWASRRPPPRTASHRLAAREPRAADDPAGRRDRGSLRSRRRSRAAW